ncbi:Predicted oxidoreductase [Kaistia soli DSM 19436]|uniref:Predicted oxidoreductase n=1 Tax=Kaistia soli DSM 19436 TaxID=1122133 RepID=A0A1M4YUI6_9HYPH|nr:aldo/keto reductase [Kaistia soli]SHF09006.1 Predicted oxidoreductase [Kaistia soli DSM 19436]
MQFRRLGSSGLLVSELALGTMVFGEASDRGTPEADALRLVDAYVAAGGNHFDLADVYAGGRAEEIVGKALKGRRADAVIATKVRWPMGSGPNQAGLSRRHIIDAIDASLTRLGTDFIDVFYMHGWDALTPLEESLRALDDLVTAGKARYIGVSNFAAWQAMKALGISERHGWVRFVAAQYQYSLVTRDIESEVAGLCRSEGMGIVPWAPLGGGFLSGKYKSGARPTIAEGRIGGTPDEWEESWVRRATDANWKTLAAVEAVAAAHDGATLSQVSLAWLLAQPAVASVIVGARTVAQFEDNLASVALALSADELEHLTTVSKPTTPYPARAVNESDR